MRRVVYGGAISLDGYLARANGAVDWLLWSDEAVAVMQEVWPRFDALVMGRRTYEFALQSGSNSFGSGMRTLICSRTLPSGFRGGIEFVSEAVPAVQSLLQDSGKDICLMGGGNLAASLLAAGLVDEIGFNIHPVLLGSGIPALPPGFNPCQLQLSDSKRLANGCMLLTYQIVKPGH